MKLGLKMVENCLKWKSYICLNFCAFSPARLDDFMYCSLNINFINFYANLLLATVYWVWIWRLLVYLEPYSASLGYLLAMSLMLTWLLTDNAFSQDCFGCILRFSEVVHHFDEELKYFPLWFLQKSTVHSKLLCSLSKYVYSFQGFYGCGFLVLFHCGLIRCQELFPFFLGEDLFCGL